MWRLEDNFRSLPFHHVGSVTRLGGRYFFRLSHLTGPVSDFKHVTY